MNATLQSQHSDAPSTFLLQTLTLTSAFFLHRAKTRAGQHHRYPITIAGNPPSTATSPTRNIRRLTLSPRLAATRAMSDTSSSNPVATMPTGDQHCYLLDLPVEMLQRITDQLHRTQTLPALRLTCRALDNVTFDRFVETFETVRCCIFYEKRWLSLKKLLKNPSRITNKIRWVEFTTRFLESVDFSKVPFALNHDDCPLGDALSKAFHTYAESQAAAIQGRPITVALFDRVLRDLKHVFPHILISCRISDNQGDGFEHLRAQRDILLTTLATHHKMRHLRISHSTALALDNMMDHLRPELLQSVSNLGGFSFLPARGGETCTTRRGATSYELRVRVTYKVLQSAPDLRHLVLSLDKFAVSGLTSRIARAALELTVSDKIEHLVLRNAKVAEKDLLKALSRWAPNLLELELGQVSLTFVRQGWSPILQLISTMPKLKHLYLWKMNEKRLRTSSDLVVVTMDHLMTGRKSLLTERTSTSLHKSGRCGRRYLDRSEVMLGLEELLSGHLRYQAA